MTNMIIIMTVQFNNRSFFLCTKNEVVLLDILQYLFFNDRHLSTLSNRRCPTTESWLYYSVVMRIKVSRRSYTTLDNDRSEIRNAVDNRLDSTGFSEEFNTSLCNIRIISEK